MAAPDAIRNAQDYGIILGQRSYPRTYELQADALGTLIAANAGYDPLRGGCFSPGLRTLVIHFWALTRPIVGG